MKFNWKNAVALLSIAGILFSGIMFTGSLGGKAPGHPLAYGAMILLFAFGLGGAADV